MRQPYGPRILPSDITPESLFLDRRRLIEWIFEPVLSLSGRV